MAQAPPATSVSLDSLLHPGHMGDLLTGVVLILLGLLAARVAARLFERSMQQRLGTHQLGVWRRILHHALLTLFVVTALREMGFHLSVLLGAAGVLSVAIGIASQTSASNLISGLFLIGEGAFAIGDTIRVGATEGEVLSIDLLSIKLVTGDNLYVRIPNEQLIRSEVVNLTRFAIRKLAITLAIDCTEDMKRVRPLLLRIAGDNPFCLDEPPPQVILQNIADAVINLQFTVWTRRENFGTVRDQLQEAVKESFEQEGMAFPVPRRSLSATPGDLPLRFAPDRRNGNGNGNGNDADDRRQAGREKSGNG